MTEETSTAVAEMEELLGRLRRAQRALMEAIGDMPPQLFLLQNNDGDSIKRLLERSADDVNFYYGRLVATAVSLPQPPGMEPADFGSPEEAKASLHLAHRRLVKLLHDLTAEDLARTTRLENTSEYTLRQVLETAIAHYNLRAEQLKKAGGGQRAGGPDDPRHRR
jgi:hypothetical protein